MNDTLNLILSLSLSASILSVILFLLKPILKDKLPKKIQYYLWLVVILRLIVPFSFESSVMNQLFYDESVEISDVKSIDLPANNESIEHNSSVQVRDNTSKKIVITKQDESSIQVFIKFFQKNAIYMWFTGMCLIFCFHVIGYFRYIHNLKKNNIFSKDVEMKVLNTLLKQNEVIRLYRNDNVSTPMLIGIIRPMLIIPNHDFNENQLRHMFVHEITHMRHFDIAIKWLSMIAISIHWFNPLAYAVRKEMSRACELACDEVSIKNFSLNDKRAYGDMLLDIAESQVAPLGVIQATLFEEKKSLKSRLIAIKNNKKKSKIAIVSSIILLVVVIVVAVYLGSAIKENDTEIIESSDPYNLTEIIKFKTLYVGDSSKVSHLAGNLPSLDDEFNQRFISMQTSEKPYALNVYYEPIQDEYLGEWPLNDIAIAVAAQKNALIMFTMIDNVDEVNFSLRQTKSDGPLEQGEYNINYHFKRQQFEDVYGDLKLYGDDISLLESVLKDGKIIFDKESSMKGLELYVWTDSDVTQDNNVYYTLLIGTNRQKYISEVYNLEEATSDIERIKQKVSSYTNDTELIILYEQDIAEAVILSLTEELSDIKSGNLIVAYQVNLDNLMSDDVESEDISIFIEENIELIMSSPMTSSNPMDYINEHRDEYEAIIKLNEDDKVLYYLLSQFELNQSGGLRGHIIMALCKDLLGARDNVTTTISSPNEWYEALELTQRINLPDFEYGGSDFTETLVYEIEMSETGSMGRGFTILASHIFGSYEEGNHLKIFATTYSSQYNLYGKVITQESGAIVPVAITLVKDDDGNYTFKSYEQTKDGSYFSKSIEEFCVMPESKKEIKGLADEILNHYGNYEDLILLERENLKQHLIKHNQYGVFLKEINYNKPDILIPLT